MLRVLVSIILLSLCSSFVESSPRKQPVDAKQVEEDLEALDLADANVASRVEKSALNSHASQKASVPSKAPEKTIQRKRRFQASVPAAQLPDLVSQESKLWSHEKDLSVGAAAEEVLDRGDAMAQKRIEAKKERERHFVAPAKVTIVSDTDIDQNKEEDAVMDGAKSLDEDLKDLRAVELEDETAQKDDEQYLAQKAAIAKKQKSSIQGPGIKPVKQVSLDHLLKLSRTMKSDAVKANL